ACLIGSDKTQCGNDLAHQRAVRIGLPMVVEHLYGLLLENIVVAYDAAEKIGQISRVIPRRVRARIEFCNEQPVDLSAVTFQSFEQHTTNSTAPFPLQVAEHKLGLPNRKEA